MCRYNQDSNRISNEEEYIVVHQHKQTGQLRYTSPNHLKVVNNNKNDNEVSICDIQF